MGALKNLKREQFAREYIKKGGNAKIAYQDTYDVPEKSAESNGTRMIGIDSVRTRILELLSTTSGTSLEDLISKTKALSTADKSVILDKRLKEVADNPTRLEATKLLFKLWGTLGMDKGVNSSPQANYTQINIGSDDVSKLSSIIDRLEALESREDRISGVIERESGQGVGGVEV